MHKRLASRWWLWTIIGIVLVIVATGAWVGVRGIQAKKDLEAALPIAQTGKAQLLAKDIAGARATFAKMTPKVAEAKQLTSDPVWRVAELLPVFGSNLAAMRKLSSATDTIVQGAVEPLLNVVGTLDPATFKPVNGAINTAPFVKAVPAVKQAHQALQSALAEVKDVDTSTTLGQVTAAKTKLLGLINEIAPTVDTLNTVVPLLPRALGAEVPRTYVVLFLNSAEARSLGGAALSSALITVDKGKISLTKTVAAGLGFKHYGTSVIPVPDGVQALYGDTFGTFIANATVRPSFESTAEMTRVMWKDSFGVDVDGVISIDPTALSYMLQTMPPISLASGDVLNSGNLVPFLLNDVYLRYPKDNDAQDAVYAQAVTAIFSQLVGGNVDPKGLLAAFTQGWNEHRILFWSADKADQEQLAAASVNGALPVSTAHTDRVGVYFQDAIGSKLDYYLKQSVTLATGECRTDGKQSYRVTVNMTNTAPTDGADTLGRSILGNWEREKVPAAWQKLHLMLYASPGSTITAATVGGKAVTLTPYHDTDYPVAKVTPQFAPGASESVTFDVVAPHAGIRTLAADVTPLISPTRVTTAKLDCATVPKS